MAVFTRVKTWVSSEVLTASDLNGEFNNLLNNTIPASIEDQSADVATMQATADPGGVGTESLATTLAGELQRLRYAIKRIAGGAQWYTAPVIDLGSTIDTADITNLAVTAAKIDNLTVTGAKIAAGTVTYDKLAADAFPFLQVAAITASGNWTVPTGVTSAIVIGCGGGGGGGAGGGKPSGGSQGYGGTGGGGAPVLVGHLTGLTPGGTVAAVIGAGGAGGTGGAGEGGAGTGGNQSSFGGLFFTGGKPGLGGSILAAAAYTEPFLSAAKGQPGGAGGAAGTAGDSSVYAAGGTSDAPASGTYGGTGGGGGASFGAGGAGGVSADTTNGTVGATAAANSGAGGGGSSGVGSFSGAVDALNGGNGGSGKILVIY